jgi:hypothetical protein
MGGSPEPPVTQPAVVRPDRRLGVVVLALLSAGCHGREGDILTIAGDAGGPDGGTTATDCPAGARGVLLLDRDGRLASYDPGADRLRDRASVAASVPRPDCTGAAQPGSVALAMDRQGAAWVATCEGELLKCDPDSGLCTGGWTSAALPRALHMAWAPEAAGGQALFLAVAPDPLPPFPMPAPQSTLLRFPSLTQAVATLPGWPALTGTVDRLWALFPGDPRRGSPARLAGLDPSTGRELEARDTNAVLLGTSAALLAASGGDLWTFQPFGTLTVLQRVREAGQPNDTTRAIGRRVVAVASSPCGP